MVVVEIGNILFYLILSVCPVWSRKYDLDGEALKLYREDLYTVVERFRRTPEYLKILEGRQNEFLVYSEDVGNNILYYYINLLEDKIGNIFNIKSALNKDGDCETTTCKSESEDKKRLRFGKSWHHRRVDTDNVTRIQRLDSYSKLTGALTIQQKNSMRDLGFQYVGYIIHAWMQAMGDEDEVKSTQQPNGGNTYAGSTTTSPEQSPMTQGEMQPIGRTGNIVEADYEASTYTTSLQSRFKMMKNKKKYTKNLGFIM